VDGLKALDQTGEQGASDESTVQLVIGYRRMTAKVEGGSNWRKGCPPIALKTITFSIVYVCAVLQTHKRSHGILHVAEEKL
jgi:hypothetical protein